MYKAFTVFHDEASRSILPDLGCMQFQQLGEVRKVMDKLLLESGVESTCGVTSAEELITQPAVKEAIPLIQASVMDANGNITPVTALWENACLGATANNTDEDIFADLGVTTSSSIINSPLPYSNISLLPQLSYKYEWTSFARRLSRFGREKTYSMLQNPGASPATVHQKVQYALLFSNLDMIAIGLRDFLRRETAHDNPYPDPPTMPLGGAGCHMPRLRIQDADALRFRVMEATNASMPLVGCSYGHTMAFGLAKYTPAQRTRLCGCPAQKLMRRANHYRGAFMDAYETEMYLRHKGFRFEPYSGTAVLDLDASDWIDGSLAGNGVAALESELLAASQPLEMDLMSGMFGNDPFEGDELGQCAATIAPSATEVAADVMAKNTVTIDVDALIEAVDHDSLYLGRSLGYAQDVIDRAIDTAIRVGWR